MAIRKVKITPETQEESLRLRAIWDGAQGRPNQAAFGEMYDIGNQSAVGQFLRGETPISLKAAVGFAKGLGCEIQDFSPRLAKLAHEASQVLGNDEEAEFITVRHVAIKFSNGTGRIVVDEGTKPPLPFRTDFLKALGISQRNAVVVDADGDSNVPSIYEHGVVLIDRGQTEIVNGKFYAFRVNGNLLIKKLTRLDDGAILAVSENRAYEPRVYRQGEDFEVLGRARWTCHQL